jgi:hypothetical protein
VYNNTNYVLEYARLGTLGDAIVFDQIGGRTTATVPNVQLKYGNFVFSSPSSNHEQKKSSTDAQGDQLNYSNSGGGDSGFQVADRCGNLSATSSVNAKKRKAGKVFKQQKSQQSSTGNNIHRRKEMKEISATSIATRSKKRKTS